MDEPTAGWVGSRSGLDCHDTPMDAGHQGAGLTFTEYDGPILRGETSGEGLMPNQVKV